MRSNRMTGLVFAFTALLTCGASPEGVEQAKQWQYQADLARAGRMDGIAYRLYQAVAETFPDTPHGRSAAQRAAQMKARLLWVERSPSAEDPGSFLKEVFDFLTWP